MVQPGYKPATYPADLVGVIQTNVCIIMQFIRYIQEKTSKHTTDLARTQLREALIWQSIMKSLRGGSQNPQTQVTCHI